MSSRIKFVCDVLWLAQPVLQAVLIVVMFRRKLNRTFPIFFSYVVSQIVIFAVSFPMHRLGNEAWFYTYWAGSAISVILGFKVIHEVSLDVFRPYHTLKDLGTVLFRWAGLVMLLVAIVVAVSAPNSQISPLLQTTATAQRCVRVIQIGLVLFLLIFSRYLGISWRQHGFGIALGFGVYASVELGLVALGVNSQISLITVNLVNTAVYDCTILVWLAYMMSKSPARETSANMLRTQRWEQSLSDIQHPAPEASLIPMFEGMVDRALSRTNGNLAVAGVEKPEVEERMLRTIPRPLGIGYSAPPERVPSKS